jgi:predicted nucleic acid-binding protein
LAKEGQGGFSEQTLRSGIAVLSPFSTNVPDRRITLTIAEGLPLVDTVGLLMHARLAGNIPALKPLLDQLMRDGFRLDPAGAVYRDALVRVSEKP